MSLQVLIAGGGPVGLVLAALLQQRGVRTVVVEADAAYCTGSRAICISRRSLEILSWIEADRAILDIGLPWIGGRSYFRDREILHFTMPSDENERFAPMINIQQYHVEEAAHRAVERFGGSVRWSSRIVDVRQDADGVEAGIVDDDGTASSVRADWLIACDGGRSTVRERLGLKLRGTQYDGRYVIVDIEQQSDRPVERLAWFDPPSNPGSTILMHRQPGDVWRIDYQLRDDEDAAEAIAPDRVLPRVRSHLEMIGESAPWKPIWISIYNAKCLTLDDYRAGRVLFAGDAAHLVPIFGVRGLNSGLDDAANLAWKLAYVVDGSAPTTLLDSYTAERLHAARENIASGAKSTEFMAPPHFGFRLMREAVLRCAVDDEAVRSLINPRQSTPIAYEDSPLTGEAPGPTQGTSLLGHPAPEALVEHPDASHLTALFGHRFVALVFGGRPLDLGAPTRSSPMPAVDVLHVFREGAATADRAIDRHGEAYERYRAHDGDVVLIRPDGYVMARWSDAERPAVVETIRARIAPRAGAMP